MTQPLADPVRACVFDAYGTLFDVASAARRCVDSLGDAAAPLAALWRDKQLQYTWLRAVQGRHADFWQVTADALDHALAARAIDDAALRRRLLDLYMTLEPYPEVPEVLDALRAGAQRLAILSNGTPAMLAAAVASAGLAGMFEAVLSVESVGVFKPHPSVYQLAVDSLGVPARAIAFISSNAWDAHAASAFGMQVIWCNRLQQPPEGLPGKPDRVVRSLAELPTLVAGSRSVGVPGSRPA